MEEQSSISRAYPLITWAERPEFAPPNILLYGAEGSGKTAGACSAPGVKLLFNNDLPNRTRFARSKHRDPHGLIKEPKVPRFVKGSNTTPTWDMMRWIAEAVSVPNPIPDVVITDPVDGLYRKLLEELSDLAISPDRSFRLQLTALIERYCLFLCEQPNISAIFVCQEMEAEKGDEEGLVVRPYVGSKTASISGLGPKIRRMVDIVGYCGVHRKEDGTPEYGAQLITEHGRTGKDGFACLGEYQPLDLARWWEIIAESENDGSAGANVETAPAPKDTSDPIQPVSESEATEPDSSPDTPPESTETSGSSSKSPGSGSRRGRGAKAAAA